MKRWLAAIVQFARNREPIVLLGLLLIVAGTWGFVELADEVIEGDTGAFDSWAVLQFRTADDPAVPIGPTWMAEVGRDITALGGVAVLVLLIAAAAGFLAIHRVYRTMAVLIYLRLYVLACAIALTALIGVSRVYMGVHYPTDVLAGWTAGLVWAIGCSLIARSVREKKLAPIAAAHVEAGHDD